MNKEKFINKLNEELDELKGKELLYFNMRDSVQEARCTNRIFGIQYALNCARLLDEPQKVKVPEFVSREIVYYRAKGFSNSQIIEDAYNSNVPNQFTKWYWTGSNKDLFFDAVAYGCIVEKV